MKLQQCDIDLRREIFTAAKRVVVKVGSAVLSAPDGMNLEVIDSLARGISSLHDSGLEVILVSSGAVAAGRKKMAFGQERDLTLEEKQALAAIGQSHLMHIYDEAFSRFDKKIAQALLTHSDLAHRKRYVNFKNTIFTLLNMGVIPIINENDTVSTEELQFGDNDNLAALVTNLIEGDLFICLTDVDCLYTGNPASDPDAVPVRTVSEVNGEIEKMAGNSGSSLGTGGMISKIKAARKVAAGGAASLIGPGREKNILQRLFQGEVHGTFFLPQRKRLQGRKQWIAFVLKPRGMLELDDGACRAITIDCKSLLPSGIVRVEGDFEVGDAVQCKNSLGAVFAVGTVNYRSDEITRIQGANSEQIGAILGHSESNVVIHRDNLVIL